jgi:ribose/xylose/arabinose/galactoside ABC-type transport system permease subunit
MKTIKNLYMEHHNSTGGVSLLLGFVLAMFNHIFGWINSIAPASGQMNPFVQALVMGFVGATISFFTTKFWKLIEKKFKK